MGRVISLFTRPTVFFFSSANKEHAPRMIRITEFSIESADSSIGILTMGRLDYGDYMECSDNTWLTILEIITEAVGNHGFTIITEDDDLDDGPLSLIARGHVTHE